VETIKIEVQSVIPLRRSQTWSRDLGLLTKFKVKKIMKN